MLFKGTKYCLTRLIIKSNKRFYSTTKLTTSYFHHASSLPFSYKTIGQTFDETAKKYSNNECYIFKNEQKRYTYKLFQDEVDSLAASLLELGFEKNDRIAIWLPNTSENVTMTYVASKLGLIKVNVNPAYVGRELEYCINKVGCKGLILSPHVKHIDSLARFRSIAPELDQNSQEFSFKKLPTLKHVILTGKQSSIPKGFHSYTNLLERGAKISHQQLIQRQASVNPDAPTSIFFTSGTTGHPKAVTLTNYNIVNMTHVLHEHLGQFFTRLCAPIPMFHIFSEIVGVLNILIDNRQTVFPDILPNPVATMRAIDEEKCTALIGAPIIFSDILHHPDRSKFDLNSLVYSALGASPMHIDFLREIQQKFPVKRVAQVYGMTENTAILTSSMWTGDENETRRLSSLGRCMQRLEIKVADSQGNPVPIGEQGEICARGFPIMLGYFNDSDKTNETITANGWLRTGDTGRMDEDGYLYYIGRQKEMIIRGGVNIYPMEIENAITEHPSVAEAQVFSIPDSRHGEEVCAWIKLKPNAAICQPEDIAEFLSDKIAFFKIPKYIQFVDKFIMTPTGKVQKFKMSEAMSAQLNNKS